LTQKGNAILSLEIDFKAKRQSRLKPNAIKLRAGTGLPLQNPARACRGEPACSPWLNLMALRLKDKAGSAKLSN
ncbi:MAG: hypothetical protein KAI83_12330, partial [Thiomargarita sp.]|nr:hypothetical protein [Thiomargarita sp.]